MKNNAVSLMECIFYSYFENIKSYYSMKVKKDGGFYNINFIDSQLEISDINNILQDHLIKFNIQNEDESPKIQIISDVNTYSVLIFVEKGFELNIDENFQKISGFDYSILKGGCLAGLTASYEGLTASYEDRSAPWQQQGCLILLDHS